MVLLWWPLTAETTVATGPKRVFHAGPTLTCARVSGEKCNGSCFCLSRRWIPVVEANPGHGGPSAERDQTTEIRSGPAGDGGFTVNTVLEDTTPAILRDTRLWISCVHAWGRPCLVRDTETISLISLHGRPLFLAARLKDHPPIPLRAAVMRARHTSSG